MLHQHSPCVPRRDPVRKACSSPPFTDAEAQRAKGLAQALQPTGRESNATLATGGLSPLSRYPTHVTTFPPDGSQSLCLSAAALTEFHRPGA